MKKLKAVKLVSELAVSVGVGSIVSNVIKATTPAGIGVLSKVCIYAGSTVLSSMACRKAAKYTDEKIDELVVEVKKIINDEE